MLKLNKPLLLFVKVANKVFDFIVFLLGLFGLNSKHETKYWYYQGVKLVETLHKDHVEQIPSFDVEDSDVFLMTYPRSGTHFTSELIDCILDKGDTTRLNEVHQWSRSPTIDFGHPFAFIPILKLLLSTVGVTQRASRDLSGYYKSVKAPRFLRSHLPAHLAPKALLAGKGKLVYVARNPKDNAVSRWKLIASLKALSLRYKSCNDFYEKYIVGDINYGSWFEHVTGYWNYRNRKNVLFLKYEDMRTDVRGTIRQLAEFLERGPFSDEIVEKIANHCTLENMRANEMINPDPFFSNSAKTNVEENVFFRKGLIGGWKNEMTEEQSKRIKEEYVRKVEAHGLTFDFE